MHAVWNGMGSRTFGADEIVEPVEIRVSDGRTRDVRYGLTMINELYSQSTININVQQFGAFCFEYGEFKLRSVDCLCVRFALEKE